MIPLARSSSTAAGSGVRRMRDGRAAGEAEQRPAHPADVEERHRHLQHVGAASMPASAATLSARASTPRWVSIAPFGKPVVPEV